MHKSKNSRSYDHLHSQLHNFPVGTYNFLEAHNFASFSICVCRLVVERELGRVLSPQPTCTHKSKNSRSYELPKNYKFQQESCAIVNANDHNFASFSICACRLVVERELGEFSLHNNLHAQIEKLAKLCESHPAKTDKQTHRNKASTNERVTDFLLNT